MKMKTPKLKTVFKSPGNVIRAMISACINIDKYHKDIHICQQNSRIFSIEYNPRKKVSELYISLNNATILHAMGTILKDIEIDGIYIDVLSKYDRVINPKTRYEYYSNFHRKYGFDNIDGFYAPDIRKWIKIIDNFVMQRSVSKFVAPFCNKEKQKEISDYFDKVVDYWDGGYCLYWIDENHNPKKKGIYNEIKWMLEIADHYDKFFPNVKKLWEIK